MHQDAVSLTNQKLYFARLQLEAAEALVAQPQALAAPSQVAEETALLLLRQALLAFLLEVEQGYKIRFDGARQLGDPDRLLEQLQSLFASRGQRSPELQELQYLKDQPASWYSQLGQLFLRSLQQGAVSEPLSKKQPNSPSKHPENPASEIPLRHLESGAISEPAEHSLPVAEQLPAIYQQLSAFIQRHRQTMQEF